MSHMTYLFLAYAVIWTALFIYLLRLGQRLSLLHKQVDALQHQFDGKEK
jgi:CcmD family protein